MSLFPGLFPVERLPRGLYKVLWQILEFWIISTYFFLLYFKQANFQLSKSTFDSEVAFHENFPAGKNDGFT